MHISLLPSLLPLASLNGGETIGLFCSIGGMAFAAVMGLGGMYFRHRQALMWHETARVALEKGQPIPAPPAGLTDTTAPMPNLNLTPEQWIIRQRAQRVRGYLIGGLINIAVGIGAYVALLHLQSSIPVNVQYFALIPVFIGIALILGAAIEVFVGRKLDRVGGKTGS